VGLVVWLAVGSGGSSSTSQGRKDVIPVSARGLSTLARALHQPIFWLGSKPKTTYELTHTPDGRIYIRYLPAGVKLGDPKGYVTVATYPMPHAFANIDAGTRQSGSISVTVPGGGVGVFRPNAPYNAYAAFSGYDYQIEVYDPTRGQARRVLASGQLRAVPGSPPSQVALGPVAVSVARLKALAASLGRPIYWAGSQPNVTYELTSTPDGRVLLRYLPAGAPVGDNKPHLTVGTYPLAQAFAVTKAAAAQPGVLKVPISGGVAVSNPKSPTNVYVGFPGLNYQIEVYSPKPGEARKLVSAQNIAPVG
jgi:hypothetical protein